MQTFAAFILSSGRCGTQWLARHLGDTYPDIAEITHEPLYMDYFPRRMLGHPTPEAGGDTAKVLAHADHVEALLRWGNYLECGWPSYAALPYLAERFKKHVRIVHLTRHPVTSASSMVTHGYYSAPTGHMVTDRALPTPFDAGVAFPDYRERWNGFTAFEKCLYFWTEMHHFALALEARAGVPWLRLSYEDIFGGDGLDRLLVFLDLPRRRSIFAALAQQTDGYRRTSAADWDPQTVGRHPRTIETAARIGYDALKVDEAGIRRRYMAPGAGDRRP